MDSTLPSPVPTHPSGSDKLLAVLCHVSGFLGVALILPLVVYLVTKSDAGYVRANAREALNAHLSLMIYALVCLPFVLIVVGVPMLIALGLASAIFAIIAAIKASEGGTYIYPLCIRFVR